MKTVKVSDVLRRLADALDDKANDDKIKAADPQYAALALHIRGLIGYAQKAGINLLPQGKRALTIVDGSFLQKGGE